MAQSELYTTGFAPEDKQSHFRDDEKCELKEELARLREEYRAAMDEIERLKNEIQFQRGQIEAYEYCLYIRTYAYDNATADTKS